MTNFKHFIIKHSEIIAITALAAVTLFFRFYKLSSIPFGLNNDAAWEGSAAYDILRRNITQYLPYAADGWRGEGIIRVFVAVFTIVLGNNPIAIRLASTVFSVALIIPIYLLIRQLWTKRIAWLTTFLIAISGWHITMGKTGWRAIAAPFFGSITLYFWFKAIRSSRMRDFIYTGICLAGSLYTYDAARIFPFFFALLFLQYVMVKHTADKQKIMNIIVLITSFFITSLPMLIYGITHWANFTSRGDYLFIGHDITLQHSLSPLWDNIKIAFLLFTRSANGNDFFIFEPLLDQPARLFFPIGIVVSMWQIIIKKRIIYGILLLWFVFSLLPGILSVPNGNRAIGAIPPVYFFSAVGILWIIDLCTYLLRGKIKQVVSICALSIVCCIGINNTYRIYLGPERRELPGFYPETFVTMPYIKPYIETYDIYVTDNFPRELLTYFLYIDGNPFYKNYTWLEHNTDFLTVTPNPKKGILFVMWDISGNYPITEELLTVYPQATEMHIPYVNDQISRSASILIAVPPR